MGHLNHFINILFDLLLMPFKSLDPFWPVFIFSLLTGVIMLLIFRFTSNQKGIKETKNRIKGYLLEVRLFKDNFRIILSAQKKLLIYNLKYFIHAVKPMVFMIVPVCIILIQLQCWFGYNPLKVGESAIFKIKLSDKVRTGLDNISLRVDKGLIVETPPLRINDENEINWKIRATDFGEHHITVKVSDFTYSKKVVVSNSRTTRLSPIVASNLWDAILYPGEASIKGDALVKRIEIGYPNRSIEIFGWNTHWLVIFCVLSIVFGIAFKGVFSVEI